MGSIFQFLDMNIILKFAISKGKVDFNFSITMNNKEYRVGAFPAELMHAVLRKWHSTMLGELMVPDRFVDVFQGRAPRNVLAKHYTRKGLERLERIYDKAGLQVFS